MNQPSIEQQQQLADELRELIREAHGVLKDLRREQREARELLPLLTDELFTAEVQKQLGELNKVTRQAMDDSAARVIKKFDELGAVLMGEDRRSRRQGKPSIPALINDRATGGPGRG